MKALLENLRSEGFGGALAVGEPMSRHCSLRAGGKAALMAIPGNLQDLLMLLGTLKANNVPWLTIGGGTNIIFAEDQYGGCVIRLGEGFSSTSRDEDGKWEIGASSVTAKVLADSVEMGFSGLEFAAGIPGTVGGAVRMNAGTGSGDFSGICTEVQVARNNNVRWVSGEDLEFSYRKLELPRDSVIIGVKVALMRKDPRLIAEEVKRVQSWRKGSQPMGVPSAGCWFLNPEGDSAGRLIDAAGLKGERVGGAEVSTVHANFLVNRGGAKPEDFIILAARVKSAVQDRFGVDLKEEVQLVFG